MDPEITLRDILNAALKLTYEKEMVDVDVVKLGEDLLDLDAWLTRGGFLPKRWTGPFLPTGKPSDR